MKLALNGRLQVASMKIYFFWKLMLNQQVQYRARFSTVLLHLGGFGNN